MVGALVETLGERPVKCSGQSNYDRRFTERVCGHIDDGAT
jgi:hypothetical protein